MKRLLHKIIKDTLFDNPNELNENWDKESIFKYLEDGAKKLEKLTVGKLKFIGITNNDKPNFTPYDRLPYAMIVTDEKRLKLYPVLGPYYGLYTLVGFFDDSSNDKPMTIVQISEKVNERTYIASAEDQFSLNENEEKRTTEKNEINSNFIKNIAKKAKIDISKYNIKELIAGYKAELEHGKEIKKTNVTNDDPIKTFKITIRHLMEKPNYYTLLKKTVEPEIELNENTMRGDKKKYNITVKNGVDNIDERKIQLLKKFLKFACKHLEIEGAPIDLYLTAERGGPIKTTASFNTENHEIWIYVKNRAIYDILRSIAHEIRHYKQSLDNVLTPDSGKTGSKHEDEANIFAGNCLRIFSNLEPSIYD